MASLRVGAQWESTARLLTTATPLPTEDRCAPGSHQGRMGARPREGLRLCHAVAPTWSRRGHHACLVNSSSSSKPSSDAPCSRGPCLGPQAPTLLSSSVGLPSRRGNVGAVSTPPAAAPGQQSAASQGAPRICCRVACGHFLPAPQPCTHARSSHFPTQAGTGALGQGHRSPLCQAPWGESLCCGMGHARGQAWPVPAGTPHLGPRLLLVGTGPGAWTAAGLPASPTALRP